MYSCYLQLFVALGPKICLLHHTLLQFSFKAETFFRKELLGFGLISGHIYVIAITLSCHAFAHIEIQYVNAESEPNVFFCEVGNKFWEQ